jgi:SAM-dependent methyltransferase
MTSALVDDQAAARALLLRYHGGDDGVGAAELDEALGLASQTDAVRSSYEPALEARHPQESIVYLPTPYPVCRAFFHALALGPDDRVVDLGCGLGRLLLYGALVSPARFRGIELIARRIEPAREAVARLGLTQIELVEGNMREASLEDGTVFYAFRPFSEETEVAMLARFHELASRRAFVVAAYRLRPGLFDETLFDYRCLGDLSLYRVRGA